MFYDPTSAGISVICTHTHTHTRTCLEELISCDIFSEGPLSELYVGNTAVFIYCELTDRMAKHQLHHNAFNRVTSTTTSSTLHTNCRQV